MAEPTSSAAAVGKAILPVAKSGPAVIQRILRPAALLALADPKAMDDEVLIRVVNLYPATLNLRLIAVLTTKTLLVPAQRAVPPKGTAEVVIDTRDQGHSRSLSRRGRHFDVEMWLRKPGLPTKLGQRFVKDYRLSFGLRMDTDSMGADRRWTLTQAAVTSGNADARGMELLRGWK